MIVFQKGYRKIQEILSYHVSRLKRRDRDKVKIFCVGRNKTGTTSLAAFFRANGYKVGNQEQAELLMEDWARREFVRIIDYCKTAEVFQDVPFSLPDTYEVLDQAFPGSKFILTVRSSPEEWYNSLVNFHAQITGSASVPPGVEDLEKHVYRRRYAGWLLSMQKLVYGYPSVLLYDRQAYIGHYEMHNARVVNYFKDRPGDLLLLNLKHADAFEKLCQFVGLQAGSAQPIPHLNSSMGKAR